MSSRIGLIPVEGLRLIGILMCWKGGGWGWGVRKVSKGSSYFLICYLLSLQWSHKGGVSDVRRIGALSNTDISEV